MVVVAVVVAVVAVENLQDPQGCLHIVLLAKHHAAKCTAAYEPPTSDAEHTVEPPTSDTEHAAEPPTSDTEHTVEPPTSDTEHAAEPPTSDTEHAAEPPTSDAVHDLSEIYPVPVDVCRKSEVVVVVVEQAQMQVHRYHRHGTMKQ
ncbi:Bile salt-activated lipase, partial [Linum grandiflorum]